MEVKQMGIWETIEHEITTNPVVAGALMAFIFGCLVVVFVFL